MAYDSATDTALANQAYERALATAAQQRSRLDVQFGLNADGSMDTSAAGQLGSIYQNNLNSVNQEHQAEVADHRRGFTGGLGHKATAAADRGAQTTQALGLRDATDQLGQVAQDEQAAGQQHTNDLGNIGLKSAYDLAQTLAANPIEATPAPNYAANPALPNTPTLRAAQKNQTKLNKIGFNARY